MDIVYSILFCERRFDFNLMRRGVGGNIFRKTHHKVFLLLTVAGTTRHRFYPEHVFFFSDGGKKIIVYNMIRGGGNVS